MINNLFSSIDFSLILYNFVQPFQTHQVFFFIFSEIKLVTIENGTDLVNTLYDYSVSVSYSLFSKKKEEVKSILKTNCPPYNFFKTLDLKS